MWDEKRIGSLRKKLLRWYRTHRRSLPWRDNKDPYGIWISEVMLQQTQTATVLPYYERFLKRFPDIASLAKAAESEVLDAWAGLGYYSRARNLHRAARQIAERGGTFPRDFGTILKLPGIGRYTAGAICSIAYNKPHPVVDGNVRRVLTRLCGVRGRVPESDFWGLMSTLISRRAPSTFNQAMMELGALVCAPSQPRCPRCPVRTLCRAKKLGIEAEIPSARKKQVYRRNAIAIIVLERKGRILLSTADKDSFIPGAWDLPWRQVPDQVSAEDGAWALCREMLGKNVSLELCGEIRHSISNRQITGFCFYGRAGRLSRMKATNKLRWVDASSLGKFLTSSIFRKVLGKVKKIGSDAE